MVTSFDLNGHTLKMRKFGIAELESSETNCRAKQTYDARQYRDISITIPTDSYII